jgi:hypothetical protein
MRFIITLAAAILVGVFATGFVAALHAGPRTIQMVCLGLAACVGYLGGKSK